MYFLLSNKYIKNAHRSYGASALSSYLLYHNPQEISRTSQKINIYYVINVTIRFQNDFSYIISDIFFYFTKNSLDTDDLKCYNILKALKERVTVKSAAQRGKYNRCEFPGKLNGEDRSRAFPPNQSKRRRYPALTENRYTCG